ncbi:uncharacterized protein TNCV_1820201, partial [Trichonephila clavipes]
MNLPPPPKRFYESLHALNNATEKVAKVSMALAAAETLSFNNGNPNVPVAIDGALRIFNRSEVLHNLRYKQYLGDGDSKAYKAVLESKPYKDVNIEKLECVGHVEKDGYATQGIKIKIKRQKARGQKISREAPGFYTCRALQEADHARIRKAEKAISEEPKKLESKTDNLNADKRDDLTQMIRAIRVMVLTRDDLADDPSNKLWLWNVLVKAGSIRGNLESPRVSSQALATIQDDGNVSRCYSTQSRPELQCRMRTGIWQLLPKATDGAQHQTCLVSSLQLP